MCKYCDKINKLSNDEIELDLETRPQYAPMLYLGLDGDIPSILSYGDSMEPSVLHINYCPFCGTKLTK